MAGFVSIGESDFRSLREAGSYYVDKTDTIYEIVEETKDKVMLFTNPLFYIWEKSDSSYRRI